MPSGAGRSDQPRYHSVTHSTRRRGTRSGPTQFSSYHNERLRDYNHIVNLFGSKLKTFEWYEKVKNQKLSKIIWLFSSAEYECMKGVNNDWRWIEWTIGLEIYCCLMLREQSIELLCGIFNYILTDVCLRFKILKSNLSPFSPTLRGFGYTFDVFYETPFVLRLDAWIYELVIRDKSFKW